MWFLDLFLYLILYFCFYKKKFCTLFREFVNYLFCCYVLIKFPSVELLAVTFPLDENFFLGPFSAIFQDLFYIVPLPRLYFHLFNLLEIEPTFYLFFEHVVHLIPSAIGCLDSEDFLPPVGFVASVGGFPLFKVDLLIQGIKQSVRVGWVNVHRSACESSVKGVIVRVSQVLQHIYVIVGVGVIKIFPDL